MHDVRLAHPGSSLLGRSNELSLQGRVAGVPTTVGAVPDVVQAFAVDSPWAPPARAAMNQPTATPAVPSLRRVARAPPSPRRVLVALAGVVCAVAVALHVSCALQHVKGNAETEGKSALEIRVAEQEVWVVRNAPQEGAGLLRARA